MSKNMIQLVNLLKEFEDVNVVNNISIDVEKGEFLTLLGPSGCGKTTTLRMIAGFTQPTSGKILLDGEDVSNKYSYERDVNTVFQSYALFLHMNIYDNIAFGLKIKKMAKNIIKEKVLAALKLVQLEGFEKRKPSQLSGGQKQRIAIARAIVNSPKVLLFDEPLGALDLKLRKQMQVELKHLQKHLGITFIYVTHDQEEALTMSDRIAVMNGGVIEQIGTPDEIYEKPKSRFVADFIGETNIFEANVQNIDSDKKEVILKIEDENIKVVVKEVPIDIEVGENIYFTIRPEKMKLSYTKIEDKNSLQCTLKERIYVGAIQKTILYTTSDKEVTINEPVGSELDLGHRHRELCISWEYNQGVMIKK